MQKYELTIVLDGKVTAAKKNAVAETIKKIINVQKGKIGKEDAWGVKELAYKIGKSDTGVYLHYPLELETKAAGELATKLKQEDDIIRFLLVRKEKN